MRFPRFNFDGNYLLKLLGAIALYTFSSRTLLDYFAPADAVSIFFIASGIGLATVLIGGNRYAPSILFGSTLSNTLGGLPIGIAMGMGLGSMLGAMLGACCLNRNDDFDSSLPTLSDWRRLIIWGGCLGCSINAVIGSSCLLLAGVLNLESYPSKIIHWWMGDTLGVIVMTPLILTWWQVQHFDIKPKQLAEALLMIGLTFLVGQIVFLDQFHDYFGGIANNSYWMFLLITWVALRLNTRWLTLVILIIALQALIGVYSEFSIFGNGSAENKTINYWCYIVVLSVVGITLNTYIKTLKQVQASQRETLDRLEKIASRVPGMVYQFRLDADGSFCFPYASPAIQDIYRVSPEQVQNSAEKIFTILHPADYEKIVASIELSAKNLTQWQHEYRVRFEDKTERWLLGNAMPQREADGSILWHGFITDITERKQAEQQLLDTEQQFHQLFEKAPIPLAFVKNNEKMEYLNKCFETILGYTLQDIPTLQDWWQHAYPDEYYRQWVLQTWEGAVIKSVAEAGDIEAIEYNVTCKDGSIKTMLISGIVFPEGLLATLIDITERKTNEEQINRLALYDPLTQLPNRRLLKDRLNHGIEVNHRTNSQMAVLMMDLDKFKAVNDNLGHAAGDELLQQVAVRIKDRLREVDTVARLGGDEFVVLLEGISHYEQAAHVADSIIHTLSQPFTLSTNHEAYIGVSIGIVIHPLHGDSVDVLMDNVDAALYHAKDQGRGRFAYFSEALTQKARERIELEVRLRRAIEQQELCVYFQPQIDISTGVLVGAEALVRWHDPTFGWMMPNQFISLAEETGLIIAIGECVLRETCRFGRQCLNEGLPAVTLAVNVSPYQFRHCNINDLVNTILDETNFPAHYLELEITESGLMDNQENALLILNALRNQGVRIAIDDFGTGYSSLAYLKYLPIDILKIDKSFVDDIPFSQYDCAITSTIIAMAHHLGFKVLAEGVETIEQLKFLREHGCDMYQGYLCSKPLSADEFAKMLFNVKHS